MESGSGASCCKPSSACSNEARAGRSCTSSSKYKSGKAVTISTSAENVRKDFRDTSDEFGQLKTGKGACDANEAIERGWVKTALSSKTRYEEWADLIRTVQIQNPFLVEQNPRKEVMREPLHFRAAVKDGERAVGENPRVRRCWLFRFRCCNG